MIMKELIEEIKLNKIAYLLEIMERKDFDSKVKAFDKISKMKITPKIGIYLIENSYRNFGFDNNNGGFNSSLLMLCFKSYNDCFVPVLEKVFPKLRPNVQNKVVYLLSTVDAEEALRLYSDLILKYYKDSEFIPISNLFERPHLYKYLFPKLFKALKFKNVNNNILILVNDYLNAGVVPAEDLKKNKKLISDAIIKIFNMALKYNFKTTFEYLSNPEYMNLRFFLEISINIEKYVSNNKTVEVLEKLLKKNDNQLKLFIYDNYNERNGKFNQSIINKILKDNASRYPAYEMLELFNKQELINDKYKNKIILAESDFYINFCIYCNYREEPKDIKYIDKIVVNNYEYYIFTFTVTYPYNGSSEVLTKYMFNMVGLEKYDGKEITSKFVGISGGYDVNSGNNLIINKLTKLLFEKINDDSNAFEIGKKLVIDEVDKTTNNMIINENITKENNKKKKDIFSYIVRSLFYIFIIMLVSSMFFIINFSVLDNTPKSPAVQIKESKLNKDCKYKYIDGNDIFKQNEKEYYVLLYNKSKDKDKYYTYLNQYNNYEKNFYLVDLTKEKNKFLFDNNDLNFTIEDDTLVKVKNNEYEYYVTGKTNILSEMKKDINTIEKNTKK